MTFINRNLTSQFHKIIYRNMSFQKIKHWYAGLHRPSIVKPPYFHIVQVGDPVLREKTEAVPTNMIQSDEIKYLITHLKTVLHKYNCVGLAAPQIGIPLKVFVMEFSPKRQKEFSSEIFNLRKMRPVPFSVFINPELRVIDYKKIILPEACESVKGFSADVARYTEVEVTGFDENGDQIRIEADGWTARIIQHEMDHLSGKLYTDIMDRRTLCCTCWQAVNERGGKIELPFSPN